MEKKNLKDEINSVTLNEVKELVTQMSQSPAVVVASGDVRGINRY